MCRFSSTSKTHRYVLWIGCVAVVFTGLLPGCRGEAYHTVCGKVTLDGEPLAGAIVSFVTVGEPPTNCVSVTDENGNYHLQRTQDTQGTPAGHYRVYISTYRSGMEDGEPSSPERVPMKYNVHSELTAAVESRDNVIDFQLTNGDKASQPRN